MDAVNGSMARKRLKRKHLPFYYSSHSMHLYNKIQTETRRHTKLSFSHDCRLSQLQRSFDESVELDKMILCDNFKNFSTQDCFKFIRSPNSCTPLPSSVHWNSRNANDSYSKSILFNDYFSSVYCVTETNTQECLL